MSENFEMTDRLWRVYLFVKAIDNTDRNRKSFASAFIKNSSMKVVVNECELFDSAIRFSITGDEPVMNLGVSMAAEKEVIDDLIIILDNLTDARYVVVANVDHGHGQWRKSECVLTNFPVTPDGRIVLWSDALIFLKNEFGLQVIGNV